MNNNQLWSIIIDHMTQLKNTTRDIKIDIVSGNKCYAYDIDKKDLIITDDEVFVKETKYSRITILEKTDYTDSDINCAVLDFARAEIAKVVRISKRIEVSDFYSRCR